MTNQHQSQLQPEHASATSGSSEEKLRNQLLEEYSAAAFRKANKLEAVVGLTNSALARLFFQVQQAVDAKLAASPHELRLVTECQGHIDTLLRLSKEMGRYAELELRLTSRQ